MQTPVMERFLNFCTYDTQSDHDSETIPSTAKQLAFAEGLAEECRSIGLSEVAISEYGYVTATLHANTEAESAASPTIGFFAHMDTSPDSSGADVKAQVFYNYDGKEVRLGAGKVLSPAEFPALRDCVGQTLITTSGNSLLGADDKAGIAEILTAMEYIIAHPEIAHGCIKVAFTPDEEVGKGVAHFDIAAFGADFAYTVDGGAVGDLEAENFNAARVKFAITGKSVHPGTAKGIMVNAALIAAELAGAFPPDDIPAQSEGYEGFFHLNAINATVEAAKLDYLIRCFDPDEFTRRKAFVTELTDTFNRKYGAGTVRLNLYDEYYNMREKVPQEIITRAERAYAAAGLTPQAVAIRGGTDGAMLSYKGLPCPNLFTGGHNFHGPYEFITAEAMEKAVAVIVNLCKVEQ